MGLKWDYRRLRKALRKWLIFTRNANAISLNAIVLSSMSDATAATSASAVVTKSLFWNISETVRASDFQIYPTVAFDSLYISTDFRLAANRTNV